MWVRLPPWSLKKADWLLVIGYWSLVIEAIGTESKSPIANSQSSMTNRHPVPSSNGHDAWLTSRRRWFDSIRDHWPSSVARRPTTTGLSFNGRMPALQASDPGSIPGGSTFSARFQRRSRPDDCVRIQRRLRRFEPTGKGRSLVDPLCRNRAHGVVQKQLAQ